MQFEAVENVEPSDRPGAPPTITVLGTFDTEDEAIAVARQARDTFERERPTDVAWWLVRREGEQLATWIADSRSTIEYVLDLRTGELVELKP